MGRVCDINKMETNIKYIEEEERKTLKGACFMESGNIGVANRYWAMFSNRFCDFGFRIVMKIKEMEND